MLSVSLGAAPPPPAGWSPEELRLLTSLSIDRLGPVPADPSNRVADDPEAAELGRLLFSDPRLSANGKVSCASCHDPANGFTDRRATGLGIGTGTRRTMPILPAIYSTWQLWDGRADSLWAQALGPLENPLEHGFTRSEVAALVRTHYVGRYHRLFGPLPKLPAGRASPLGDPEARRRWATLSASQRQAVDRVFVKAGKAIAAFERRQRLQPTRFDLYLRSPSDSSPSPLSHREEAGLRIFIGKGKCTSCHGGPLLTNSDFANTGVPVRPGAPADEGLIAGVEVVRADPFNCKGAFSDDPGRSCDELEFAARGSPEQVRAYKVPSLRGVALRPPYMHAGQYADLERVVSHYSEAPAAPAGRTQLRPLRLNPRERGDLVAFLKTLSPTEAEARQAR